MNNLTNIKEVITPILLKNGVSKAGIFGSAVKDNVTPRDVDILVKIDKRISLLSFIAIQHQLEDALGMKVDLVEYDALKPILKSDILEEEIPVL